MGIDTLLSGAPDKWIDALDDYQKNLVLQLINENKDPLIAAEKWLSYGIAHTYPFGVQKASANFLDNVKKEIMKFLCGDPEYNNEREELSKSRQTVHNYVICLISSAIAIKLGTSLVFLAPVVAIILFSFGKCTLKAICATYKESAEEPT